jgi:hypothetical protein
MAVKLSALHTELLALYLQEDSWYSFLLEAESTPRQYTNLKSIDLIWNRNRVFQLVWYHNAIANRTRAS